MPVSACMMLWGSYYLSLNHFYFHKLNRNIICAICIIACIWLYYFIVGRKIGRAALKLSGRIWCIVAGCMVPVAGMMAYFTYLQTLLPQGRMVGKIGACLVFAGDSAICILVLLLIYYFNSAQKYKTQSNLLGKYNEEQRIYFLQQLKKEQDTKRFRHDVVYDLLQLTSFCEQEDYNRLKGYLQEMLGHMEEIRDRQYDVGNEIINTIINYYFQPIQKECRIIVSGYMKAEVEISQRDLCTVVSNLVKNAVEAVSQAGQTEKEILFSVGQGKEYLSIQVKNTVRQEIAVGRDGLPKTTKIDQGNHGFGLRNVSDIVKKYNGTCIWKVENECYTAEVFLKM